MVIVILLLPPERKSPLSHFYWTALVCWRAEVWRARPLCACLEPFPPVEVGFVWWFVQACTTVNAGESGLTTGLPLLWTNLVPTPSPQATFTPSTP